MRSKTKLSLLVSPSLVHKRTTHTRKNVWSCPKKKLFYLYYLDYSIYLSSVEIAILIINQLKFTIMQKFIISVKTKHGQDVIPPYIVNDLTGFGHYSERITANGLVVLVDSLCEENNFVELPKSQDNGK